MAATKASHQLLFDDSPEAHGHVKILGGGMVGTHAGNMIGIGMAAEVAHGSRTDWPPAKKWPPHCNLFY